MRCSPLINSNITISIQPAIKNKPPKGVKIQPTAFPLLSAIFQRGKQVQRTRKQNDARLETIARPLSNAPGYFSNKMATASKAKHDRTDNVRRFKYRHRICWCYSCLSHARQRRPALQIKHQSSEAVTKNHLCIL